MYWWYVLKNIIISWAKFSLDLSLFLYSSSKLHSFFSGKGLCNLRKLQVLRLDSNKLCHIETVELLSCSAITVLNLSNNQLESLEVRRDLFKILNFSRHITLTEKIILKVQLIIYNIHLLKILMREQFYKNKSITVSLGKSPFQNFLYCWSVTYRMKHHKVW